MTTLSIQTLLCTEEFEDAYPSTNFNPNIPDFCPDLIYYYSLLAPNMSPPVLPCTEVRMKVIDWILKVSSKTLISRETAHVAVSIFDKSLANSNDHRSCSLLLLAMASLMLASKFLEKKPILIEVLNQYSDYQFSQNDIIKTELQCLKSCNFKIPSCTFARWLDFLTQKWDEYIISSFNVPDPSSEEKHKIYFIMFRREDASSYRRFQRIFTLCDLICMNNRFYAFDHRILAFAVLWKVVYFEFVADNMEFYNFYGFPSASALFGLCNVKNAKTANDWIFDLLMQFSKLYIGECFNQLADLFEFIDIYINLLPISENEFEKYLKFADPEDRSYEKFLNLQGHSPSYLKVMKILIKN